MCTGAPPSRRKGIPPWNAKSGRQLLEGSNLPWDGQFPCPGPSIQVRRFKKKFQDCFSSGPCRFGRDVSNSASVLRFARLPGLS